MSSRCWLFFKIFFYCHPLNHPSIDLFSQFCWQESLAHLFDISYNLQVLMTAIFIATSISKQIAAHKCITTSMSILVSLWIATVAILILQSPHHQPCHERHGTWALGADAGAAVSSERVALAHRIRWEILQEFPLYLMVITMVSG